MKAKPHSLVFLFILFGTIISDQIYAQKSDFSRKTIHFNREWKYVQGDFSGAEAIEFDDHAWENIGLPHSFSIPYFMSKDFYIGYGWYRKTFPLTTKELTRKIFLEFDGVFQEAEIYVNGKLAGQHAGGYTGFSIDLSPYVKAGDNQLAVRVNNIWKPDLAPRAGEHVFSGGIYRNVRLVMKNPAHIAWYGTYITTPTLAQNQGKSTTIQILTEVCNDSDQSDTYRLRTEIRNSSNHLVTVTETDQSIPSGETLIFSQETEAINSPELWQPEHPTLYHAISILYQGKREIDRYEIPFGFRWFQWTADQGFFLNGKHFHLKGANVHQDQAGWGDAITEKGMLRDVRQIKEAGFNFIRGSHYPHSPAFSRACDEEGILFWSEAPFWGIGGFKADGYWNSSAYPTDSRHNAAFEASALQQLKEMIRIHRNHPSIIAWSMSNEPFFSAPEVIDGVHHLLKEMVSLSRQLDPTRPAAIGGAQRPLGSKRIDLLGDLVGYNGDGGTIADFQNPPVPNLVSEYGSTTADRPGKYEPGWGDLARGDGWKGFPWRSGQAIWCGFDHGSIAGSDLGKMGIIDYFRIPKRSWYWYRNEYCQIAPPKWPTEGTPARIKLEADRIQGIGTDGSDDVMLHITILDATGKAISNSPTVELRILEGPGEFPTGSSITVAKDSDIRIADGTAAIALRSFDAGKTIVQASSPELESAQIMLTFVDGPKYKAGKTPQVKERPYVRFIRQEQANVKQTFGRNNPTFASSSAQNHAAGMAADGEYKTWWQPTPNDTNPSWILDTEKGLVIQEVTFHFPEAANYQYKIEVSEDQKNWKMLTDARNNTHTETQCHIIAPEKTTGRFVRISFQTGTHIPRIAEVEVTGIIVN